MTDTVIIFGIIASGGTIVGMLIHLFTLIIRIDRQIRRNSSGIDSLVIDAKEVKLSNKDTARRLSAIEMYLARETGYIPDGFPDSQ